MSFRRIRGAFQTSGDRLSPYSSLLTELELASELILGADPEASPLPEVEPTLSPLEALCDSILPFLERPPCLVSFSGGRDSSTVLAVATDLARREGLELPIPITQRYPNAPDTDEKEWQELVVRHVGSHEWIRQELADEFDFIGPLARECLLRHGVLYPPTAYFVVPMLREARSGSLLTGIGGDEVMRKWLWARAASVLACRVRPTARDILRVGVAFAPVRVRAAVFRRRMPLRLPWLHPTARKVVLRRFYMALAAEPTRWDEHVRSTARQRDLRLTTQSLNLLGTEAGADVGHPLLAPRFLAALGKAGGSHGFGDLASLLRAQFGSLLPAELIARPGKSHFNEVFWGPYSREFVRTWGGEPAPVAFVDERSLFDMWRGTEPQTDAATVIQALWLSSSSPSDLPHTTHRKD